MNLNLSVSQVSVLGKRKNAAVIKYKNDIILIAGLLILTAALFLILRFTGKTGRYVQVTVDQQVTSVYPLDQDREEKIVTDESTGEYNLLIIKDGEARVTEATCPDKICVHHQPVSKAGETIVCLPHKLVVTVVSGETREQTAALKAPGRAEETQKEPGKAEDAQKEPGKAEDAP